MASPEFGWFTLLLFLLIASAQVLGFLFTRLRQPKVVGEILAGVLLGPCEPLMGTANQWVPLLLVRQHCSCRYVDSGDFENPA